MVIVELCLCVDFEEFFECVGVVGYCDECVGEVGYYFFVMVYVGYDV